MSGLTLSRANKFVNVKKSVLPIPVAALSSKQQQQLKNVVLQIVRKPHEPRLCVKQSFFRWVEARRGHYGGCPAHIQRQAAALY